MRRWGLGCLFLLCIGGAFAQGGAQPYPNKPVRIVVPFPPGGGVDITTRLIASKLSWGQQVVVENRAGAGSVIGTEVVARSAPDGYTLLMTAPPFTTNAALVPRLPFDPLRDFAPVTLAITSPLIVVVHPSLPVNSIDELIALAKARPGQLSYGSSGNGGPQHLAVEMFKSMAKIDLVHVPYKGSAPLANDLSGGHVLLGFGDPLAMLALVKQGRLRALAVTGSKRLSFMPDLPTVAESLPGYEAGTWTGLLGPAGTPSSVIESLSADIARVLNMPEIKDKLASQGTVVVADGPAAFGRFINSEIEKVRNLAKTADIRIE